MWMVQVVGLTGESVGNFQSYQIRDEYLFWYTNSRSLKHDYKHSDWYVHYLIFYRTILWGVVEFLIISPV